MTEIIKVNCPGSSSEADDLIMITCPLCHRDFRLSGREHFLYRINPEKVLQSWEDINRKLFALLEIVAGFFKVPLSDLLPELHLQSTDLGSFGESLLQNSSSNSFSPEESQDESQSPNLTAQIKQKD